MAWHDGLNKAERLKRSLEAVANAKRVLRPGDRITATRCPGTKRWFILDHWDGNWIVSRSGIDDISPANISKVNGEPVNFLETKRS